MWSNVGHPTKGTPLLSRGSARLKPTLLLAALATLFLLAPTMPAPAHTLSKRKAGARAWKEAKDAAEAGDWYGARACSRQSRHKFTCVIWTWTNRNDTLWDAYVNVRIRRGHRTVAGRWYEQEYYDRPSRPRWRGRYLYEWMWVSGARARRPAPQD